MPAQLLIQDGPAGAEWNSDSIRVRSTRATSLTTVGPHTSPQSGADYYTYVRVENTGTDPFGHCSCPSTGAWAIRNNFIDVNPPANGPNGMTVTKAAGYATLNRNGTQLAPGTQWLFANGDFWSWSPNGQFFAYVHRDLTLPMATTWSVSLVATAAYSKTPPAVGATPISIPAGTTLRTVGPTQSASPQAISGINIGWNPASTCLHVDQPPMQGQNSLQKENVWICPFAGTTSMAGSYDFTANTAPVGSGPTQAFKFLYSPCGDLAAIVPTPAGQLMLIDLRTAMQISTTASNVLTAVSVTGNAPGGEHHRCGTPRNHLDANE